MSGEKNTEKDAGFQMGTEPTTFRMLGHLWAGLTTASRSHIMSS